MGLPSINSLMNMELMLYPQGSGTRAHCPTFGNGYMASSAMMNPAVYNPYMYNNGYYVQPNASTSVANNQSIYNQNPQVNWNQPVYQTLDKDMDKLADYALEINEGAETFKGACMGGVTFAAFENMQNVKHPLNSFRALKETNKIFDMKNPALKKLWAEQGEVMQNAYSQTHAAYRRMQPKRKFIQQWFAKPLTEDAKVQQEKLINEMKSALASGDKTKIIEATEKLKASRGMDGYFINGWNWFKNNTWNRAKSALGFKVKKAQNFTPLERVNNKITSGELKKSIDAAKTITVGAKIMKEFKNWAIFEGAIEMFTKIIPTYMKGGNEAGNKQVLQSGLKVAASSAGWAVGRAVGSAVGTTAGAAIGTAICPGLGTAAGAIIGFAGGCIGSWIGNKLVKKIIPHDENEKLAKQEMLQTEQGQAQLLQLAYQKAQEGEAPKEVVMALNNVIQKSA